MACCEVVNADMPKRQWFPVSLRVASFLTIVASLAGSNARTEQEAVSSPAFDLKQQETGRSSELVPAISPEQLTEFCLTQKQTGSRQPAILALERLVDGLRAKHATGRLGQNLLRNGDFEEWDGARPQCWVCYTGDKSGIRPESTDLKSGTRALRIDLARGSGKVTLEQSTIAAVSCLSFELAGWIKRTGDITFEITVSSGMSDGSWKELRTIESGPDDSQIRPPGSWWKHTMPVMYATNPADASPQPVERVKVSLVVKGDGTLWLDDVSLMAMSEREMVKRREEYRKLAMQVGAASGWQTRFGPTRYWFPSGHVFDASSRQPIQGAMVVGMQVIRIGRTNWYTSTGVSPSTSTNSSGFFELREPVTAPIVAIGADGYERQDISFEEDDTGKDLMVFLERKEPSQEEASRRRDLEAKREEAPRPRVWFAGYVRDARTGRSVEGATVSVEGKYAVTNSRGFFLITPQVEAHQKPEDWQVDVRKEGYRTFDYVGATGSIAENERIVVNLELVPSRR